MDAVILQVDSQGRETGGGFILGSPPLALASVSPYMLALSASALDVFWAASRTGLAQHVPLGVPCVCMASDQRALYVAAADASIIRVHSVQVDDQMAEVKSMAS